MCSCAGLTEILEECLRIEAWGWKGEFGTAMPSRLAFERFYTDVALRAAANGRLVLTAMRVDGRLVAFNLALQQSDSSYGLRLAFDKDYRRGSAGIVLMHEVVRRAFESRCTVYDWLGGAEPCKEVWTDGYSERSRLLFVVPTPLGDLTRIAIVHGQHLPDPVVARGKKVATSSVPKVTRVVVRPPPLVDRAQSGWRWSTDLRRRRVRTESAEMAFP